MLYACRWNLKDSLEILLMFDACQTITDNPNTFDSIINFQNKFGHSAIFTAASYDSLECMQILLEYPQTNVNLQKSSVK